jgi:hypothetical protein
LGESEEEEMSDGLELTPCRTMYMVFSDILALEDVEGRRN